MADAIQPTKESFAMRIIEHAIREKWIEPDSYLSYLNAIARAILALQGTLHTKESMKDLD